MEDADGALANADPANGVAAAPPGVARSKEEAEHAVPSPRLDKLDALS